MPGLTPDDLREALRIARDAGLRTVRVQVDDDRFDAVLGPGAAAPAPTPAPARPVDGGDGAAETPPAGVFIHSPAVGVFRAADPPLAEGDEVAPDRIAGAVVALGLANDVLARVHGTVAEVLVRPGDVVDYHRPLFRVNP